MTNLKDLADGLGLNDKQARGDTHAYGEVMAINEDGTYQVSLNGSDTTVRCARLTGAKVGDTVMVTLLKNGYAVVTGCVGGDRDAEDANEWTQYLYFDENTGLDVGYRENEAKTRVAADGVTFFDQLGGVMGAISNGDSTPTSETVLVRDSATLSAGSVLEYAIIGQPDDDVVFALSRNGSEASVTFTEPGTATLTHPTLTASVAYDGATITCTVQTATSGEYGVALMYHTVCYNPNIYVGSGALAASGNAAAFGEGVITGKQAQTAIGTYNAIERSTNTTHPSGAVRYGRYALVVGNGTAAARSNALAFRWDGDVEMYIDTTAAANTYDGMIRDACTSLGWNIL